MRECAVCSVKLRAADVDGKPQLVCPSCFTVYGDRQIGRLAELVGEPSVRSETEARMQARLMEIVRRHETLWPDLRWVHHSPSEASSRARARIMRTLGCRAGVFDLEWPLMAVQAPACGEGTSHYAHGLAIELKAGKNQLTPAQRDRAEWLRRQEWVVAVCRSVTEAWQQTVCYAGYVGQCQCPDCGRVANG